MPVIEASELAELVRGTPQRLELSQVKFAKKPGVLFQSVNRWENGRIKTLPVALKQIEQWLHQIGDSPDVALREHGKDRLAKYFLA